MDEIIRFEGAELADLLDRLEDLTNDIGVTSIEVCVDGGFKIKVNGGTWSPPLGTVK